MASTISSERSWARVGGGVLDDRGGGGGAVAGARLGGDAVEGQVEGLEVHLVLGDAGARRSRVGQRRRPRPRRHISWRSSPGRRPSRPPRRRAPKPPEMFWRSYCSSRLAISQPPLRRPTRLSLGIFTSVKKVSQNGDVAADQLDRPGLDARRGHVDQHEADAFVLLGRVGAHQAEAPVGLVGVGGPDLLAVDQPVVALVLAAGGEAGEVGAGARLRIALAPADLALDDLRADVPASAPRCRIPAAPDPASRGRTTPSGSR